MQTDPRHQGDAILRSLDSLRTGLAVFDAADSLVYCNRQFFYFFPGTNDHDDLVGTTYARILRRMIDSGDVSDPLVLADRERWIEDRLGFHRAPYNARTDRLGDGRWIDVKERRTPDGGSIVQWTDATDRLRFDIRLRATCDCIADGFAIWDQSGRLELFNRRFAERHFCGTELRPGMHFKDVLVGLAHSGALSLDESPGEWMARRLDMRDLPESREIFAYRNGSYVSVQERKGEDGSTVVAMTDVTDLKQTEAELRFRGQTLEKLVYELEMSKSALEEQGRNLVELAESLDEARRELDQSREALRIANDGLESQVEERTTELRAEIDHHKETLRELLRAKEQAEYANHAKTQFLANMSHEFRTPLNAIIGFAEILRNELFGRHVSDKYREYAADIHRSGVDLLSIISDLLDIAKIDAGTLNFSEAPFSLERTAVFCLRLLQHEADRRGITLSLDIPPGLPKLNGDQLRVRQILVNLVSNGVKFNAPGGRVDVAGEVDPSGAIVVTVSDNGIGIRPQDVERVLEPFAQIRDVMTRNHEGSGLGLHMARSLMELHGGTLELASDLGKGTTATLRFPPGRTVTPGRTPKKRPG